MKTKAELIEIVLNADPTRQAAIVAAATGTDLKPRPGTIREAAEGLNTCSATVRRYAKRGLLTPIRITPRCIRYDLNQVEALATRGAA